MDYTTEQARAAYKNLSEDAQYFIAANETTDLISKSIQDSQLSGEPADQADSQILYAMYGLQSLDDTMKNIASLSQKPVESLAPLKSKLKENVFDKLEEIKKTSEPRKEGSAANLPMVEEGEVAHEVPHVELQPTTNNPQPTTNEGTRLTTDNVQPTTEVEKPPTHYPGGVDPYREPLD